MASEDLIEEIVNLLKEAPNALAEEVLSKLREETRERVLAASKVELSDEDKRDIKRLIEDPDWGYEPWMSFLKSTVFHREGIQLNEEDKPIPTKEQVKDHLNKELSAKQIEILKDPRYFQKPQIVLIPVISNEFLLPKDSTETEIDKRILGGTTFYTYYDAEEALKEKEQREFSTDHPGRIIAWEVGIIEAAEIPHVLPGEDLTDTVSERMEWFDENLGVLGIAKPTFPVYALLAAQAHDAGKPIDVCNTPPAPGQVWALLGETKGEYHILGASWDKGSVTIDSSSHGIASKHSRQRLCMISRMN